MEQLEICGLEMSIHRDLLQMKDVTAAEFGIFIYWHETDNT